MGNRSSRRAAGDDCRRTIPRLSQSTVNELNVSSGQPPKPDINKLRQMQLQLPKQEVQQPSLMAQSQALTSGRTTQEVMRTARQDVVCTPQAQAGAAPIEAYGSDGTSDVQQTYGDAERIVMKAIYPFIQQNPGDLPFDKNDRILLLTP